MSFPSASKAKKNIEWKSYWPEDLWRNDCGNMLFQFETWDFGRREGRGNADKCTSSLERRKDQSI